MPLVWVQHLPQEDQEQFVKTLINNLTLPAFQRLRTILDQELNKLERSSDFSLASWAFKQAYDNGARDTLNRLKGLITIQ